MPRLRPFRGLRYRDTEKISELVCPPYDIISPEEQGLLHERHPHNAVRLELAKDRGAEGYPKIARLFQEWDRDEIVRAEENDSLYVYRQDFEHNGVRKRVAGVIGALELEAFGQDAGVLPHERTMEGPKADRLALLEALMLNVSPIYGIYRGAGGLAGFYGSLESRPPAARFADDHGILHRLWVISAPAEIEALAGAVAEGPLVIADGHHRYETALTFHESQPDGAPRSDSIMCFCVDADAEDLVVLPYNRAAKAAGEVDLEERLMASGATEITDSTTVLEGSAADHPFVIVTPDRDLLIEVSDDEVVQVVGERAPAWRDLDVVALHEALFPRLLPEGTKDLVFSKDPQEIRRLVTDEGWDVGFLLKALGASQIVDVARSGERMPQKASYFWPKAITGLVFHSLR